MTWKSKLLLLLTLASGLGIGLLSQFADGMYAAMSLFLFPIVFSLWAVVLGLDFKKQSTVKPRVITRVKSPARRIPRPHLVRSHGVN
jgi:hypothetical protein